MEEYADYITRNGMYLGLLDLGAFCEHWQTSPTVIAYDLDFAEIPAQKPLQKILNELSGVSSVLESYDEPNKADPSTWYLVACRADFQRDVLQKLNHWMPAWPKEQLGDLWETLRQATMSKIQKKIASTCTKLQSESCDSDDEMKESLEILLSTLTRKQECFQKLMDLGLFPVDVAADGNCMLWALDALKSGPGVRTSLSTLERVKGLREESCLTGYG